MDLRSGDERGSFGAPGDLNGKATSPAASAPAQR